MYIYENISEGWQCLRWCSLPIHCCHQVPRTNAESTSSVQNVYARSWSAAKVWGTIFITSFWGVLCIDLTFSVAADYYSLHYCSSRPTSQIGRIPGATGHVSAMSTDYWLPARKVIVERNWSLACLWNSYNWPLSPEVIVERNRNLAYSWNSY